MAYLFLPKMGCSMKMPHRSEGVKNSYEIGDFIVKKNRSLARVCGSRFPLLKMAKKWTF